MKIFTYEDVLLSLKHIIHEREDYVYEQTPSFYEHESPHCAYFDYMGQPSCIVGHFLAREELLDASHPRRAAMEGDNVNEVISVLSHEGIASFSDDAVGLLFKAQCCQDEGTPWGESVERAVAWVQE